MKKNILIAVFSFLSILILAWFISKGDILVGLTGIFWMLGILTVTVGPFILFTIAVARIVKKLDVKDENE
jgi:hypothetical protein